MRCKRLIAVTFIITLLFTSVGYGLDDQSKLKQVQNAIKQITSKLSKNKEKEKTVSEQIKDLDLNISKSEEELGEISKEVTLTQRKIDDSKKDLKQTEENIGDKNDIIDSRLKVMYKNGNIGYLEVLLSSESIVDLFSKLDMMKMLFEHDMDILKVMKEEKDLIETKKRTLESHESKMIVMLQDMENKRKELEVSRGELRRLKSQIQQDSKGLENQIDELNAYAEKIAAEIRKKQSGGKYTGGEMAWPAPGYTRITSPYGYRIHPILKTKKLHTGIDIGISSGKSVVAAGDGKVIHANWLGGYGKVIMIDHGGGIVTLYAHNSSLVVSEGDKVKKGDVVSKAGSTGMSTGPHLHFEVRKDGKYVDPIPWVK